MAKRAIHVCTSKRRFADMASAQVALKPGLKPYLCPSCGGFHLTSSGASGGQSPATAHDDKTVPFDLPVLLRANGGMRKRPEGTRRSIVAVCVSTAKSNGNVRFKFEGQEYETTEPVQPANLRHLLRPGLKLKIEACLDKPFYARVVGLK
jgi:hypothetical protein